MTKILAFLTQLPISRNLVTAGISLFAGLWISHAVWPTDRSADLQRAEANGLRAAQSAAFHRSLARAAIAARDSAIRQTDSAFANAERRVRRAATEAASTAFMNARVDSQPRVIVGPVTDTDSLVALAFLRARVQFVADVGTATLDSARTATLRERATASLAILHLNQTIADKDSVITSKDEQLAIVKASRPAWWRRGLAGIGHAGAGIACGSTGWVLGGPVVGLGAGAVCAAVAGILK